MSSLSIIPTGVILVYVILFGLCIGSFLNVVILRGLSGEDIVFDRSKCPKCNNKLKWYMNIPLLSYIFLRGKCAYCKTSISPQYPIVEFITGLIFAVLYLTFGLTLKTLLLMLITSCFIVLAVTDILETVIICYHAYILAFFGVLYSILHLSGISVIESILAGILAFVLFEIISRIGLKFINLRAFGEGDSYIAFGIGTVFGIKITLIVIMLSVFIQSIVSLPMIIYSSFKSNKTKLAISYLIVTVSIIYTFAIKYIEFSSRKAYLISVAIIIVALLYCLRNIFVEIGSKKELIQKTLDENDDEDFETGKKFFMLLPFGPALIISSIICIFYSEQIKTLIKNFLF